MSKTVVATSRGAGYRMRNLPGILLAALLASGCAGIPEIVADSEPPGAAPFELVDARPDIDKQTRTERVGDNLVRYLLGDDRIRPTIPNMLASHLHGSTGNRLAGKIIKVTRSDIRVYRLSGSAAAAPDKLAYAPAGASPGAAVAGLLLSDLLDMGFTEKRIEVEIEGVVDGKTIKANEYGYYTFGSPEKETLRMIDSALRKFSAQVDRIPSR